MISWSRTLLALIALLFGSYHGILGLINLSTYRDQNLALFTIVIYFAGLFSTVLLKRGLSMHTWVANLNLIIAATISLVLVQLIPFESLEGYETWHVGGVGTLMALTAIRSHRLQAVLGMALMTALTIAWGGYTTIFTVGLIGSWIWLAVGIGSSYGIQSSSKAAEDFFEKSIETAKSTEASTAARAARQQRIDATLKGSLPMLTKIWTKNGLLSDAEKKKARLLEAKLRDEIRGRKLVSPKLVDAIEIARKRGVEVQLLDDGGLVGLSDEEINSLTDRIASEIAKVKSGKLVIRAVPGETWRVTVVALRKNSNSPDLFLRL